MGDAAADGNQAALYSVRCIMFPLDSHGSSNQLIAVNENKNLCFSFLEVLIP